MPAGNDLARCHAITTAINSLLLIPGYYSEDPNVFLDAFDFWDQNSGIAFGDAINVGSGADTMNP